MENLTKTVSMKNLRKIQYRLFLPAMLFHACLWNLSATLSSGTEPGIQFILSFPDPRSGTYHVEMRIEGMDKDTLLLTMPRWMPGYYQIMEYAEGVSGMNATSGAGITVECTPVSSHSWQVIPQGDTPLVVQYDITTGRKFVANSYVDSAMAYILPENTFLYPDGSLGLPVSVEIEKGNDWEDIATGLEQVPGAYDVFFAPDYDILYDCPILIGDLDELPPFEVNGVEHRFTGYQLGKFDVPYFINALQEIVETATDMFGDIPYDRYTFIGIGPGLGGIEHLNNTTISFNGNTLTDRDSYKRVLAFIAHEYFHHYNVKRIRPYELGPFDYSRENRTNQLWVSEGLTVYYEYLLLRRAGLIDETELLRFLSGDITAYENDQGRKFQSLQQASYYTWEDGPFGTQGGEGDRSISYYQKGAIVGLMLDFRIRHATGNLQSLDDVMRLLYDHYYRKRQRGFTEAEFQQACEQVAGAPLGDIFKYIYTTEDLDYEKYLAMAGLTLRRDDADPGARYPGPRYSIIKVPEPDKLKSVILAAWQQE